jgi:hypothetical protein
MTKGTRTALLVEGWIDEEFVKRAEAAAEAAPPAERVRAGLEAAIEIAETDPAAARSALIDLRGDHEALGRLEGWLGGEATRAAFGLGAALQVALTELAGEEPDLRGLLPELLRWLEGDW